MKRVAVIGGGFGGMTAAGELQRSGHQVTLFEAATALGGKAQVVSQHGVTLDTGPTLLTLPDVVRATFERLGATDLMPRLHALSTQAHYRYPDGRSFSSFADLAATAESARVFGDSEADGVHSFYTEAAAIHRAAGEPYLEAPYEGMASFMARVARRGVSALLDGARLATLAQLANRHFRSEPMRNFVGRFATYARRLTVASERPRSLSFPHIERAFGVHHVEGGMAALVRALGAAITRVGVQVHLDTTAHHTRRHGRYLAGPVGHEEEFDAVVVNADPMVALGRGSEPLALSGYVLLVEVDRRLSLPHHTIVFSSDYRREFAELFAGQVPTDPTVYVCHPASSDQTVAPPGKSGLFVMVNAPALTGEVSTAAWQQHGPRLREQVIARVKEHFAELRGATVTMLGERTPVDLQRHGAPGGSIYGFLPHGKLGPFRRPRIRGATPGLFYSGGGTHPGGGVPLVMLSGPLPQPSSPAPG